MTALLLLLTSAVLFAQEVPATAPQADPLPAFVMVLDGGNGASPDLTAYGATKYDQWYDRIFIRITDEQARELSKHPRVRYVQRLLKAGETSTFVAAPREQGTTGTGAITADAVTSPSWESGTYRYDGAGNVTGIGSEKYLYDRAGRLTEATLDTIGASETYTYDSFGNLNSRTRSPGSTQTTFANGTTNRLVSGAYDAVGNFVSGAGSPYAYEWDSFRMMSRQSGSGRNDYYVYDANDERIGRLNYVSGSWKWTIRDAAGQVVREYEAQNAANAPWIWTEDFVYDGRGVVGAERPSSEGGRLHFHRDHLGSVRMVTNHSGQAISRHDYAPFGAEITSLNQQADRGYTSQNTKAFTGHERDYNSGTAVANTDYLDYMHARYYSPAWGRFLSVDPSAMSMDPAEPQTWNRYSYAVNNPINVIDPDGQSGIAATPVTEVLGQYQYHFDPNHGGWHIDISEKRGGRWVKLGRVAATEKGIAALAHQGSVPDIPKAALKTLLKNRASLSPKARLVLGELLTISAALAAEAAEREAAARAAAKLAGKFAAPLAILMELAFAEALNASDDAEAIREAMDTAQSMFNKPFEQLTGEELRALWAATHGRGGAITK